jgi:hypothetical protein
MRKLLLLAILPLLTAAAPSDPVDRLQLGYRLAAWAREAGDADAMLVAARLVAATGARNANIEGDVLAPADSAEGPAAALADEAVRMAPDDRRIAAAAEAVRGAVGRGFFGGPSGGPLTVSRRMTARSTFGWSARARGGEMAIVSAVGDGDSDIDLKVVDGNGRTICFDEERDYFPVCRWSVRKAGAYRIEVTNKGRVPTHVMVLSN